MAVPILWAPGMFGFFLQGKTSMPIKFLVFFGGGGVFFVFLFLLGGGSELLKRMRLFCFQLEASCLQWSFFAYN